MAYHANKELAIYRSTKPTKTDQSQARDTDINRIVSQYLVTAQAPGSATPPRMGDMTQIPDNLRDMIHQVRNIQRLKATLPEKLRDMPMSRLLALKPDELATILTPPAPPKEPDAKPKEEGK